MATVKENFARRQARVRRAINKVAGDRSRLSVFRSHKHIYAQVIDNRSGFVLASASSLEKDMREKLRNGGDKAAAAEIGKLIAVRAAEKGVGNVVFDRGGYLYHGRVKALADAAREGGLQF